MALVGMFVFGMWFGGNRQRRMTANLVGNVPGSQTINPRGRNSTRRVVNYSSTAPFALDISDIGDPTSSGKDGADMSVS